MKKSLLILGVLAVGFANAQQEGKVGINTDAPSASLTVKSKTGTTSATKNLELQNANDKKLVTVLDDGNVGIGTVTPTHKLHIVNGAVLAEQGHFRATHSAPEGGNLVLQNDSKNTNNAGFRWRLHNMGRHLTDPNYPKYTPGLHFLYHDVNGQQKSDMFFITDEGKVAIGLGNTTDPTEKLHIKGNVRVETLPANTGANTDKVVVVDNTGVLKTVERSALSGDVKATPTANNAEKCTDAKAGSIHYNEITQSNGKKKGVFAFCTKNTEGQPIWFYFSAGQNSFPGTATFGEDLPQ